MPYLPLGVRTLTAAADQTGLNPGNLTAQFTEQQLALKVPYVECYHICITGVPAGAVCQLMWNNNPWGFTAPGLLASAVKGAGSEIEYAAGMLLQPGDEVDFLFSVASSATLKPQVTMYLRYDIAIPANRAVMQ